MSNFVVLDWASNSLNLPYIGKNRADCESETVQNHSFWISSTWWHLIFLEILAVCIFFRVTEIWVGGNFYWGKIIVPVVTTQHCTELHAKKFLSTIMKT